MITTIEEAQQALTEAELEVALDGGVDAVEAGWYEIVRSVADHCAPDVAAELLRRNT